MTTVDARGLSCPEPVMMTSKAMLTKENEYVILVDNTCSRENVTRFAEHQGYSVSVDEKGGEFTLTLKK
ncbi:MAG: sulfurtransferase TusA family protein [Oscillospiraceae bacterium]|nr:sulfurtransferase TusA family protein [Oscillospiraceae bacterium]MBQ1242102.1 sulfurtransferase TusA family protein [Oscillospiraceae bacterium]MBQ5739107.1 sulfurtransferase TusA family protein [Oscillospiraceae bacterium]